MIPKILKKCFGKMLRLILHLRILLGAEDAIYKHQVKQRCEAKHNAVIKTIWLAVNDLIFFCNFIIFNFKFFNNLQKFLPTIYLPKLE